MKGSSQFKIFPKEWREELIGAVCDIKHGFAFDSKDFSSDFLQGNPIVLTPGNFTEDGKLVFNLKNTKRLSGDTPSGYRFNIGDLVVVMTDLSSKMKILGKPAFIEIDNVLHNQRIGRIVFLNRKIEKRYLYYFMLSERFLKSIKESATGTMVKHTAPKRILNNLIPFPQDLKVQERIVSILDEAFDGIATAKANAEKNLQNARALFESHLQSVFTQRGEGWMEKPLETVAAIVNGYAFKSSSFTTKEGVKCIKITNVGVGEFVCESGGYLPNNFAKEYHAVSIDKGSIVIALTRTIIAGGLKVALVPEAYNRALLNQRVAAIQPNETVLSQAFLFAYLSTQEVAKYVTERVNTLMQPNLSIADLKTMPIPIPSGTKQKEITGKLNALRNETKRLESIYQQKLAALDELKKSLLHQAFNGQL
jgi:type I restriction enzyme, S subunit